MRQNATPDEVIARLIALERPMPGVAEAYGDIGDTGVLADNLPAFVNLVGRVVSADDYTFGQMMLVQDYTLLQYVQAVSGDTRYGTDGRADILGFMLPVTLAFRANPRLAAGDGGIVAHSLLTPDGIPRRLIRDKKHYWGLVYRLRVTTYHAY
jgi:hypothetical protein